MGERRKGKGAGGGKQDSYQSLDLASGYTPKITVTKSSIMVQAKLRYEEGSYEVMNETVTH